jgi:hypothetical protein
LSKEWIECGNHTAAMMLLITGGEEAGGSPSSSVVTTVPSRPAHDLRATLSRESALTEAVDQT